MTRDEYATIVQAEIQKLLSANIPPMQAVFDGTLNAIEIIVAKMKAANMTDDEFRAILKALSLTDREAGRILGCDPRTIRRWASMDRSIPPPVAKLLRLMASGRLTLEEVANV